MKQKSGNLHPHYPKPKSQKPQKGPELHGFHGVPGSSPTKAQGKKILEGEQREDLMPDANRKIQKFPREWPTEKATKAKAKKSPAKPKASKAKKVAKAKKVVKAKKNVKAKKIGKAKTAVKAKKPLSKKTPNKSNKGASKKKTAVKSKKAATKKRKAA